MGRTPARRCRSTKMCRSGELYGSTAVGADIAQACAPDFKHCSLEMGGKISSS